MPALPDAVWRLLPTGRAPIPGLTQLDISRKEQRLLHALAQGGAIHLTKTDAGKIEAIRCFNREGWLMPHCDLRLFRKLKRLKAIASRNGQPYRITRRGLELVRAEYDNR